MAIRVSKFCRYSHNLHHVLLQFPLARSISSLEQTIKAAVESKAYQQIPDLLVPSNEQSLHNSNPFSFLSDLNSNHRTQIVDEILQAFIPLRPRSRPHHAYSYLLSHTLQTPNPLPLALAILQRILRSGLLPVPQTRLFLASAWLNRRQFHTVAEILLEMETIGYKPDCGTCNYLINSLCDVDNLQEAVDLLKGMSGAGCVPDSESYGTVIGSMCRARKTCDAVEIMKEMVGKLGLNPIQGIVVKLTAKLRGNREIRRAVDLIEFLEKEGCCVGFESYELVLEGCLECKEYVLAGKLVMKMTEKGFIPYIKARKKVVEGLAAGNWELACAVRHRFAKLNS